MRVSIPTKIWAALLLIFFAVVLFPAVLGAFSKAHINNDKLNESRVSEKQAADFELDDNVFLKQPIEKYVIHELDNVNYELTTHEKYVPCLLQDFWMPLSTSPTAR